MKSKLLILFGFFSFSVSAQNLNTITGTILGSGNDTTSGTLLANTTYTVVGNILVPIHDTLFLQSGVTVCVEPGYTIIVKGALISLGTEAAPNWFTACGVTPVDQVGNNPATDPAWNGGNGEWTGINCDTSSTLVVLKWTHINYVGAVFATTLPFVGGFAGATSFGILFQNLNGCFIMEDSWMYGTVDDAIRMARGKFDIMRNTFEKAGYIGGDCLNMKNGSVGDCGYNLFIGCATNGTKASNKGGSSVQCNMNIYNNTYVDCGYRQASYASSGSDIDYEQAARGECYNNLIVNCRNGIRVADGENAIPWPDTTNLFIGSNYIYADSVWEVNQFFPIIAGSGTKPSAYVIPTAVQLNLPANFYDPSSNPNGDDLAYNDPALAQANNPLFVNFILPETIPSNGNLSDIESVNTGVAVTGHPFDFHLQAGSPAIGIGNSNASYMLNACASVVNPNWGPDETPPCIDMGCFPNSCARNTTNIDHVINNSAIAVYPNPNHGSFNVVLSDKEQGACEMLVYNVMGEKISQLTISNSQTTIDLSNQPSGIYFYRIVAETGLSSGKMVGEGKLIIQK